jgi:hypothetical protein
MMANSVLTAATGKLDYNAKDIVRGIINEMPDDCTLEDIMLELYVRASILESRQQIASGQGLSLAQARKELDLWFTSQSLQNSSSN